MIMQMQKLFKIIMILLLVIPFLSISGDTFGYAVGYTTGKVVDFFTKRPIKGAIVVVNGYAASTDEQGVFKINATGNKIAARAHGYMRAEQDVAKPVIT